MQNRGVLLLTAGTLGVVGSVHAQSDAAESVRPQSRIQGVVREKGTRKPLAGVSVFILPLKLKAVTDSQGRFALDGVDGTAGLNLVVNLPGYIRFEKSLQFEDFAREIKVPLERASYQIYETTVFGQGDKRDEAKRSLKASEFLQAPGAGGDPIKAVQNLPGIARPSFGAGTVVIQGSAPQDTIYQIDGQEVPIVFHFGGLSSVIIPEAIDRVDYLAAGYGPENGRALGGLIGVTTRSPQTDRTHGFAFVDTYNAGGILEGKLGENSGYLIGGRQSYVGQVLRAVLPENEQFNFTVAPEFSDLLVVLESEPSEKDRFKMTSVASRDRLEFLFSQPTDMDPSIRGSFSNTTQFFRLIPQWEHRFSENATGRMTIGAGKDLLSVDIGGNFLNLDLWQMTTRGEWEWRASPTWTTQVGWDNRYTWSDVSFKLPTAFSEGGVTNPFSSGDLQEAAIEDSRFRLISMYWRNEWKPSSESPWTLLPSLRTEWYSATQELLPVPRFSVRYQWDDSLLLKFASGLYVQQPQEREVDENFGNPDLSSQRALHLTVGYNKDFREGGSRGLSIGNSVYYRYFDQLVRPSASLVTRNGSLVFENFDNSGRGDSFGLETLLKLDLQPWQGWLTYTLSRARRWSVDDPTRNLFDFDQTHLLTLLGSVDLPGNWKISARLRYVTGNPTTPIVGAVFDADNDVYQPIRGAVFSQRLTPFFQADLRVDKKWVYEDWMLSLYLDILNATNRQNREGVSYSYDYSESAELAGIPIFPTFGLRAEF